jgi:uncharacterized protein YggU (UPF0235/DUF167 family)
MRNLKIKIKVKIHPGSSQEKMEKIGDLSYEIWLKEKPVDNKANIKLIKLLKKHFGSNEIKIKSGFNSRIKVVEIIS